MSYSVMYDRDILNRYVCDLSIGTAEPIKCIIDTACSTTLIPLKYAKSLGKKLNHSANVIVGGNTYKASLYLLEDITFGDLKITKMVAFAADYKGNIEDRILLGLNVLNNLEITLSRQGRALRFSYKPWILVKNKENPCTLFFKDKGANPVYPDALLVEIEDSDVVTSLSESTVFGKR